ncbi:hypothetical protein [Petroclostridium sp. X23]|uniref:hypothetical protein n=1 Tax=Petroclostridium sp. X23 TaxID=3045146 RepID=UPI0024ADEA86|nr:hypothetical protein [Petroclostridium sp. X23]WHH58320.1 hypothetical protein QKW49_21350 [Petroclostridium sp. X23]
MISATGLTKTTNFINDLIARGRYTIGGVVKYIDIYKTEVSGNTITKYLYIANEDAGTITNLKLIDKDGDIYADRPDSISKASNKGILVSFKITISEV